MVALVAGLIAIGMTYLISATSARHFHEQQRISMAQSSLRMAMSQLRADVQRAGFLGTPNSSREQNCFTSENVLAVEYANGAATAALPNAATNGVVADRIRLTGNYATGGSYHAITIDEGGGRVFLQRDWQAFRRDFGPFQARDPDDDSPERPAEANFREAFRPGRVLHIVTRQGNHFFQEILGNEPTSASIRIDPIPVGGHCTRGLADGATVSPLSRIEYTVVNPRADATLAALVGRGDAALDAVKGQSPSVLVRREVDFTNAAAPLADPATGQRLQRVVLENVAEIRYGFTFDSATNVGAPPVLVRRDQAAASNAIGTPANATAANAHHVRTVHVELSTRTMAHDPRFAFVPRAAGQPLTRYQVSTNAPGAARVRTMRSEVFLPNVALRGLRP